MASVIDNLQFVSSTSFHSTATMVALEEEEDECHLWFEEKRLVQVVLHHSDDMVRD